MSIETICQGCGRKLRVGDEFAGRRARCPHCRKVYTVPDSPRARSEDRWLLRTADERVYGPVPRSELDHWLAEGRIDVHCQLKRETDDDWQPAGSHFPALTATASAATGADPFQDRTDVEANPYAAPSSPSLTSSQRRSAQRRLYRPHRGGSILALGLFSVACCTLLSPVAWAMGHNDLKEIKDGVMDPTGRGLTIAGMVLGIIGTVILGLNILASLLDAVLELS